MKLSSLIEPIIKKIVYNFEDVNVLDITTDSRNVTAGSLFVCIEGHNVDGHSFANQAINNGAIALITQKRIDVSIPQVVVTDIKKSLPIVADRFFNQPTKKLNLIGITGTNGKTTTTYLIEKIYKDYGQKVGVIGTIEMRIGDQKFSVENTTPEPITLQRSFKMMVDKEVDTTIIEVSSHALELGRVAGCDFDTAIFTNLTQDHMDFHGNMDIYKQAKAKLFSRLGNSYNLGEQQKFAILNADDNNFKYFDDATIAQSITYGIDNKADVQAKNVIITANGTSFNLESIFGNEKIDLKLTGKFSVYNALAAISCCLLRNIPLSLIKKSLEEITGVPGRFESVNCGQNFGVIIDYAHTPNSLDNVLKTIKEFSQNRIITVFGCGGDRDVSKRPIMGDISYHNSDITIVTSDNPRTEDPKKIMNDILAAFKNASKDTFVSIRDRADAIEYAVNIAEKDDVILIAGKGHENYQIIGLKKYDFDDRLIAEAAIRKRLKIQGDNSST